jgi:hypothetical protein
VERCLQLLNDCQQSISLEMKLRGLFLPPQQHEAYISRLLELQRKARRTEEETETAKLPVVLIADYEAKHFTIEKVLICGARRCSSEEHQGNVSTEIQDVTALLTTLGHGLNRLRQKLVELQWRTHCKSAVL